MAENADDIELENLDRERETQQANEEDTNLDDDRPGDKSVLIIDGSNPDFSRVDDDNVRRNNEEMREADRELERGIGAKRRVATHNMKKALKDGLGVTINKGDGPNSTLIYDKLNFRFNGDKVTGATYDGKELLVLRDGKLDYSKRTGASFINNFKEILRKAEAEHQRTPAPIAEERAGVDLPQSAMDSIIEDVNDRIDSEIERRFDEISSNTEITANELRN